mmetsp:Transcript_670/g.1947  ORF Transcript_670/g.1947 Transcript_670/m.1947 type:complete len:477 (+) Transcript_670:107-1537(+)
MLALMRASLLRPPSVAATLGATCRVCRCPSAAQSRLLSKATACAFKQPEPPSIPDHLPTEEGFSIVTPEDPEKDVRFAFRVGFRDVQNAEQSKLRLDHYLAKELPEVSRAKLQHGIRLGLVTVNGNPQVQKHTSVRAGDIVRCALPPPPTTTASPEDIPLEIVFEDEHLMVVNKAAGMVVHPAPGHPTGTLVNAVLHHCGLPALDLAPGQAPPDFLSNWPDPGALSEEEDPILAEEEFEAPAGAPPPAGSTPPLLRPGIVHRLDMGTTGLMVVAKDATTQWHLSDQFKAHTVERTYHGIVLREPIGRRGIVEARIARDPKDRKRMTALPVHDSRGRWARSRWEVLEPLAQGGAALVKWNLETGRTHQIRVHAKHVGHPLFGDVTYGGHGGHAQTKLAKNHVARREKAQQLLVGLGRPALHAKSLGFEHPITGQRMQFDSQLPDDLEVVLHGLRHLYDKEPRKDRGRDTARPKRGFL